MPKNANPACYMRMYGMIQAFVIRVTKSIEHGLNVAVSTTLPNFSYTLLNEDVYKRQLKHSPILPLFLVFALDYGPRVQHVVQTETHVRDRIYCQKLVVDS